MWDEIFIGSVGIGWNVILYTVAIFLGLFVVYKDFDRYKIPKRDVIPALFWGLIFAFIGAKLFYLIFFTSRGITSNIIAEYFNASGSMYYGAEIVGVSAAMLYVYKNKLNLFGALDLTALFLFVAHGVGRIGCYGSGCCYGTPTDSFLGVTFPGHIHSVHPTQLYETVLLLSAFMVIWLFRKRIKIEGLIYCLYVMFYSTARFTIEFIRDDGSQMGFGVLNISPSQYIALVMFVLASALLFYLVRRYYKTNRVEGKVLSI